jgi:hypothetical protein
MVDGSSNVSTGRGGSTEAQIAHAPKPAARPGRVDHALVDEVAQALEILWPIHEPAR